MNDAVYTLVSYDLPVLATALLAAISCALLGNFLVLRRMSLMGDAISHAVLPGLIIAFLVTGSRAPVPMLIGAIAAGVVTVVIVEVVRRVGRVESGAAMGVVFTVLFALGVILMRRYAHDVHLDVDCVLNGQLEQVFWLPPDDWASFWAWGTFFGADEGSALPPQLTTLALVLLLCTGFVLLFFKELRISSFDPSLATSLGINAHAMHLVLMVLVAVTVVASFEAVGSVLVIAMLICPPATARMLTDRLWSQVVVSLVVAVLTTAGGYALGANAPTVFGTPKALSIPGMMTVVGGLGLTTAIIASPRHGVVTGAVRRLRHSLAILREDLLAMLYRLEEVILERPEISMFNAAQVRGALASRLTPVAIWLAKTRGEVRPGPAGLLTLTDDGRAKAMRLIRTHRLWESYLVRELGLRPDHVHRTAMDLEHITDEQMERELLVDAPARDPHDKPIPGGGRSAGPDDSGEHECRGIA